MGTPRMTWQTLAVLDVLLADLTGRHYGLELTKTAGLKPGTIYPILARLEEAGWLTSSVEAIDPTVEGRRPRRYYELTGHGEAAARAALADARTVGQLPRFRPAPGEA